ncbi:GNAT family N-acetyltransferase [Aurantimonas endophytica]
MGREPAPMSDDYGRLVGSGCVWVLVMDEEVGGLIVLRREADHVLVSNVAVGRAHQGRGFGRRLLTMLKRMLAKAATTSCASTPTS